MFDRMLHVQEWRDGPRRSINRSNEV
jgi:hypothetical protein